MIYEAILEFLDNMDEHGGSGDPASGRQLHLALAEALTFSRPPSDYYRHHPWKNDGGYLLALTHACQAQFISLPAYTLVYDRLVIETGRSQVLALNHCQGAARRDLALRRWTEYEYPYESGLRWFELSGAATASLTVHALLALAAEPASTEQMVSSTYSVYFPRLSLITTMLDSYVDRTEDLAEGRHSYIAHYYGLPDIALSRLDDLIGQSLGSAVRLHNGHRHAVVASPGRTT